MPDPGRAVVADWLLVPGWGFGASTFDEVRAALPSVLTAQAIACREAGAALDRRVAAVRAGLAPPFGVCAWSLGATISLDRAAQSPESIAMLVVVGATPRFVAGEGWPHAMPEADFDGFAAIAAASPAAAQSRLAALCALGLPDAPALLRRLRRSFDRPLPGDGPGLFAHALLRDLALLREADLRDRLAGIDLPVTVLHGEQDALVPVAAARIMAGRLPRAAAMSVTGAGHALPVTHPGQLAATIAHAAGLPPVDAHAPGFVPRGPVAPRSGPRHATARGAGSDPDVDVKMPR